MKKVTVEAFRDGRAQAFPPIPDKRVPQRMRWELPAVLRSAVAMSFFQHPSVREDQRRLKQQGGRSHLERVFEGEEIPSDAQLREMLAGVPTEPLRRV